MTLLMGVFKAVLSMGKTDMALSEMYNDAANSYIQENTELIYKDKSLTWSHAL